MGMWLRIMFVLLGCAVICWLALINPPAVPTRSLDFSIKPSRSGNGLGKAISITLSNCSDDPIQFYGNVKTPGYEIECVSNNIRCHSFVPTFGGTLGKLPPHALTKSEFKVPDGVTALKIGLSFTSLSWRGRAAWCMIGDSFESLRRPAMGFLVNQDIRKRSKVEWSDEYFPSIQENGAAGKLVAP
jgi:hypothetical protein